MSLPRLAASYDPPLPASAATAGAGAGERPLSIRSLLNSNSSDEAEGRSSTARGRPRAGPPPALSVAAEDGAALAAAAPYSSDSRRPPHLPAWRSAHCQAVAEPAPAHHYDAWPAPYSAGAAVATGDAGHARSFPPPLHYQSGRPAPHRAHQHVARTMSGMGGSGELRYRPYPDIMTTCVPETAAGAAPVGCQQQQQPPGSIAMHGGCKGLRASNAEKRRRRTQACEYCHMKKVKCEGDGARCQSCIKNDVQCVWGQKRKRGPKPKAGAVLVQRAQRRHRAQRLQLPALAAAASAAVPGVPRIRTTGLAASHMAPLAYVDNGDDGEDRDDDDDDDEDDDDDGYSVDAAEETLSPPLSNGGQPAGCIRMPQLHMEVSAFFTDNVAAETREAVRFYFDYFYPLSPMFHPSLFIRRVVRGEVDPLLIDAMKATTARVIERKTGRAVDGKALALSVKQRILAQMEQPTVDLVRVIVVMTLLAGSYGEYVSYNSLICLAASLVVRLGWHRLDLYRRPPPVAFEEWAGLQIKRRVFWLVYQIDSYQAMLTGRPMSIAEDSVYVLAPCSDYEWDSLLVSRHPSANSHLAPPQPPPPSHHPQARSRSSSGSGASSLRPSHHEIVATGAFSHSFTALCELTSIIAKINTFLCDTKACRSPQLHPAMAVMPGHDERDVPFPAVDFMKESTDAGSSGLVHPVRRTVALPSEYPMFVALDERLEEWRQNLVMPEDLRDDATEAEDITYFGTADHRRFMMRIRYLCLHCYYVPITIFLHQSNRPSFFTEYEQPLEVRLAQLDRAAGKSASPAGPEAPDDAGTRASDRALREMLNVAFASTWSEGLLAYDVEARSWDTCVRAAKGLSENLRRNSDFPLDRFDQVIPFCIFMSVSVLIRQVRKCSRLLVSDRKASDEYENRQQRLAKAGGPAAVADERLQCIECIRHQWKTLQSLGALWDVEGMKQLLKSMQIDEVANAADLLSSMSL